MSLERPLLALYKLSVIGVLTARSQTVHATHDWLLIPMTTLCRFFETFSFLPPLDDAAISKQVDYIIRQGWIPCLEFADADHAYVKNDSTIRFGGSAPCNYYDNR